MSIRILNLLRFINCVLDLFFLNSAFFLLISFQKDIGNDKVLLFALTLNMIWVFCVLFWKLYDNYLQRDSVVIYRASIKAFLSFTFGFFMLSVFLINNDPAFRQLLFNPIFCGLFLLVFFMMLMITRLILLSIRKNKRKSKNARKRQIVLVGGHAFSKDLTNFFITDNAADYQVLGVFYDKPTGQGEQVHADYVNGLYKGRTEECLSFIENNKVDEVYCVLKDMKKETVTTLFQEADRHVVRFRMVLDLFEYFPKYAQMEMINNVPVLKVRDEPLERFDDALKKRAFDIVFSSFVVVFVLSWLYPLIALLIKLESPGPVLFKQMRSGKNNTSFNCLKFRSMYVNEDADVRQAQKGDPRVTRIGRFLRKTSLDELPQFFNVLWGNMSVVGPRPHMLKHTQIYSSLVNGFMVRHFLTPGITGWAQVNGFRGETKTIDDMQKRVKADVWYLENWSLLLDLKIIFLTVWNGLRGDKYAY